MISIPTILILTFLARRKMKARAEAAKASQPA